jgi:hypothetical protein
MTDDSITVYCTNGNVIFNSDRTIKEGGKKPRCIKIKKNIVNEIFDKMRSYNDDPFWDMFLLKASRNNFPKGFSFRDDTLFYSMKVKYNFEIKLNLTNPQESFTLLRDFMKDKGVLSHNDKLEMNITQIENNKKSTEDTIENWKDLNKLQTNAISIYITKLTQKYSLNIKEKKHLQSTIKIGISSGYFNAKNIIVKNSAIEEICYLVWNEEKRLFNINTKDIRIKKQKYNIKNDISDLSADNTTTCRF